MGFLALVNAYTMRITLSVAITQMVKRPNYTDHGDSSSICLADDNGSGQGVSTLQLKRSCVYDLLPIFSAGRHRHLRLVPRTAGNHPFLVLLGLHDNPFARWHFGRKVWRKIYTRSGYSFDCNFHIANTISRRLGWFDCLDCSACPYGTWRGNNIPGNELFAGRLGSVVRAKQDWIVCVRWWSGEFQFPNYKLRLLHMILCFRIQQNIYQPNNMQISFALHHWIVIRNYRNFGFLELFELHILSSRERTSIWIFVWCGQTKPKVDSSKNVYMSTTKLRLPFAIAVSRLKQLKLKINYRLRDCKNSE